MSFIMSFVLEELLFLINANSFLSTRFQFLYMDFYILGLPTLYDVLYLNVFYNVVCLGGTIIFIKYSYRNATICVRDFYWFEVVRNYDETHKRFF